MPLMQKPHRRDKAQPTIVLGCVRAHFSFIVNRYQGLLQKFLDKARHLGRIIHV